MSLDNEAVNIYSGGLTGGSAYTIIPNSYKIYVIPSTGVTAAFDIILPTLYDNSIDISSFRILNYSSFDIKLKYIASATDTTAGTLTILATVKTKSSMVVDGINQSYIILDSLSVDSSGGGNYYLPLSGGTINGNLTVSAKAAGTNYGPTMIIDGSSIRSHGKVSLNGTVVSAMLSEPICDLDIYQSANLSLSSSTKTAGIRLYSLGAGPVAGTSYILGIDRSGGLSLFKTTGTTTDVIATFDLDGGISNIVQKTPSGVDGGQIANKTYVDTRYIVTPSSIVPNLTSSNGNKTWSVIDINHTADNYGYKAFNDSEGEWVVDSTTVNAGSDVTLNVASNRTYILGGFGIAGRISTNGNSLPSSWTISGANNTLGPYTTLYTGTSTITALFQIFYIDFRSIVDSSGNPAGFKYFRYSGISGGVGNWGMTKFELYAAVPISSR